MIDLRRFTLGDMTELGSALRRLGEGAGSMEEVATALVCLLELFRTLALNVKMAVLPFDAAIFTPDGVAAR